MSSSNAMNVVEDEKQIEPRQPVAGGRIEPQARRCPNRPASDLASGCAS